MNRFNKNGWKFFLHAENDKSCPFLCNRSPIRAAILERSLKLIEQKQIKSFVVLIIMPNP